MNIRFFEELKASQKILIAGAGGGFDVYAGLPLYFYLRKLGKEVELANLAFTEPAACDCLRPIPEIFIVPPHSHGPNEYFPERVLARWLGAHHPSPKVYAFERRGVQPTVRAYQWLQQQLKFDTLILVDGGTDILMRGDESGLGTPQEDIASLLAADALQGVPRKFIACIGFGIDSYHGVCHAHFLENVANLIQESRADGTAIERPAFLGSWALTLDQPETLLYLEAVRDSRVMMRQQSSIVNTSIAAATEGWYGNRHPTPRTRGSELFLNPLMSMYWTFDVAAVARQLLYRDWVWNSEEYGQICLGIEKFRETLKKYRPHRNIPH